MDLHDFQFSKAVPIWEKGTENDMNRTVDFFCRLPRREAETVIFCAASTSYRLFVNGKFLAHGPARAGHGYYRVDRIEITDCLTDGDNEIRFCVSGCHCNSFCYIEQSSFLCAQIEVGGVPAAWTGDHRFEAYDLHERVQKVQRYSFQRAFAESYRLGFSAPERLCTEQVGKKKFLVREVPYGTYAKIAPIGVVQRGTVTTDKSREPYRSREITDVGELLHGYREEEQEVSSHQIAAQLVYLDSHACEEAADCVSISEGHFADLKTDIDRTGLMQMNITAKEDGVLLVLFDEMLTDGEVYPFRLGTSSILYYEMKKGTYSCLTAEPYVFRYVRLIALHGVFTVENFRTVEIAFPQEKICARLKTDDPAMRKIFSAAIETFRANTVDIYMDCPSRERAGWLCDSFFTARVERLLTGKSEVERAFLQNFLMPDSFRCLPKGMLPMCYPADFYNGEFIPNWSMWYVLELKEYLERTGDAALVADAREKMYALVDYFKRKENEFGLLENLDGWVFVDWSEANNLVQDVSFPSNMMYVAMKSALASLYGDDSLAKEADALRETIRRMSKGANGFYCDNAVRKNGVLVPTGICTESCQYYAFFCGIATLQTDASLWNLLLHDFGSKREKSGKYPDIHPSNAFIGVYLRLELLDRYGFSDVLRENIPGYFLRMAEETGTLWEKFSYASLNHGFASYVLVWMKHLGIWE